jgi:hypothetical protein
MKTLIAKGKTVSDDASKVCVLFDPKDGRVVHVHGVTILNSGNGIGATEMEARARKHAERFGKSTAGLRALHVPITAIRGHGAFRVNERGDGLVPVPRRPRRMPAG